MLKNFLIAFIGCYIGYSIGAFVRYRDIKKISDKVDKLKDNVDVVNTTLYEMWEWKSDGKN